MNTVHQNRTSTQASQYAAPCANCKHRTQDKDRFTMAIQTVDQAAGVNSGEQLVDQYRAIPLGSLKSTTRNKLTSFWKQALKGITEYEPHVTAVEFVGDNFLISKTKVFWEGYLTSSEVVTLGDLAETREVENESSHVQFEVQLSRVEKLLTDKEDGILNGAPLMQPIVCMQLPKSEQFIIVSGRHRLSMLLTLCQTISGWAELGVPVLMFKAESKSEVIGYIRTANGSRSMTQTEKAMLEGAAAGINLSVYRDVDELYEDSRKASNVTELKKFNRSVWAAALSDTVVDQATTINGVADIGNACLSEFSKRLKALAKGADKVLLEVEPDGTTVYEQLTEKMTEWVATNWHVIEGEFQEPKKVRGVVAMDENNQPVMLFNPSRKARDIGKFVANLFADKVAEQLAASWQVKAAAAEAAAKAKTAAKAKKNVNSDIKNLDDLMKLMRSQNTLTPEVEQAMMQQREALVAQAEEAKAEAAQQTEVPTPQQVVEAAPQVVPQFDPNAMF